MTRIYVDTKERCLYCGERHVIQLFVPSGKVEDEIKHVEAGLAEAKTTILAHELACMIKHYKLHEGRRVKV